MARIPIHPGKVDWSGENPGMYLKETADGPFVTLVSFFRVVVSPYGPGFGLVLFEAPQATTSSPNALNVCVTDNDALMRWLMEGYVANFGAFRGVPALTSAEYRKLTSVAASGDNRTGHVETVRGDGIEVVLTWEGLDEPFIVEMPVEKSATGKHDMFSLFIESSNAKAVVNGRTARGRAFPRDFAGKKSSTAFLAFSETWVRA